MEDEPGGEGRPREGGEPGRGAMRLARRGLSLAGRAWAWRGGILTGATLQVPLGLYIVRGDNIAIVGEVDPQLDNGTDWANLRAEPLKHIVH